MFELSRLLKSSRRGLLIALGLVISSIALGAGSSAQAAPLPKAYFNPGDVPAEVLVGEQFKFKVRFKNNATPPGPPNIGYGPVIDLALDFGGNDQNTGIPPGPCDGIDIVSAKLVDVNAPVALTVQKYGASNPSPSACPQTSNVIPHPIAGIGSITLPNQRWQGVALALPFGSFDPTQPEIVVEVTATVHSHADLNVPLQICERGAFQFGASATGATPIFEVGKNNNVGTWDCEKVTPKVFTIKKSYVGPENETATGPNFVRKYTITVDVAAGQTIGKLTVTDCMPDGMVYGAIQSVIAPPSWGPFAQIPPLASGTMKGCLSVNWPASSSPPKVVGVAGPDATITFSFWVADKYLNGTEILDDTCKPVVLTNAISATGFWIPIDPRDMPGVPILEKNANAHKLTVKCLAIQKSVKLHSGAPGYSPGDVLKYTLEFQISDYKTIGDKLAIVDQLSNGQTFQTSGALTPMLTLTDRFGSHTINLTSTHYTSAPSSAPPFGPPSCPKGATELTFNIAGALMAIPPSHPRHIAGILTGGHAANPPASTAATGTLVFYAKIDDAYSNASLPVGYVDKHDPLCNAVKIYGVVYKNDPNPAVVPSPIPPTRSAEDDSAASVSIVAADLKKTVYAVKRPNGTWACAPGTCAPGQQVNPGDDVTFRIEYLIPSGDAQSVTITDWLPKPVFDVGLYAWPPGFVGPCPQFAIPAPGQVRCGPTHSIPVSTAAVNFPQGPFPAWPQVVATPATNSIRIDYGTIFDTNSAPQMIDLLFTAKVTNVPYADGLNLTNETQECEKNTFGATFCQTAIAQVQVREPQLRIRKGVIATNNPNSVFSQPSSSPMTAKPPSGVTFGPAGVNGVVTSDSVGGLVDTNTANNVGVLFDSDVSNVDANDLATFAIVVENTGGHPAYNVSLNDLIPWAGGAATCFRFEIGPVIIKNGAGATVMTGPTLNPSMSSFNINLGSIPIPALDAATINTGANVIIITFKVRMIGNLKAGCCENKVNLTKYTSTPAPSSPNFVAAGFGGPFKDAARVCMGPLAKAKCIQSTSEAHTTIVSGQQQVTIGEIVRYRLVTTIPEGTTQNLQVQDFLPAGMTYTPGSAKAMFIANATIANTAGIPTLLSAAPANCPGTPTPTAAIGVSVAGGSGADPAFPATPITITNADNDNNNLEYLVIEFNAQVDNASANQDGTTLSNQFRVKFTDAAGQPASNDSAAVSVSIVEPKLVLTKTANPATLPTGGGPVTFTIQIANQGTATAFDLAFTDTLPNGFFFANFLQVPTGCTSSVSGQTLNVNCPSSVVLPVNGTMTIKYEAKVDAKGCGGKNQAGVTWTSLPGLQGTLSNPTNSSTAGSSGALNGERNGTTATPSWNDYRATGSVMVQCGSQRVGTLHVGKVYEHPLSLPQVPANASFGIAIDCVNPADGSHTTYPPGTIVSPSSGPVTFSNIPVGYQCTIVETVPSGVDASGCYWAPGLPLTPNPATIHSGDNYVGFSNRFVCPQGNPSHDLAVYKVPLPSRGPIFITVQNVGSSNYSAADLASPNLTTTDYFPPGSTLSSYGSTNTSAWQCTPAPGSLPATIPATGVQCTYIGGQGLASLAALPQIELNVVQGAGSITFFSPANNGNVTVDSLDCVVTKLSNAANGDAQLGNSQACIGK